MRRVFALIFAVLVSSAVAESAPVVKPRAHATEYQAVGEHANATIGAAQLSSKQVRKSFVSNMRKDYIVVEIGVYPKTGFKLSPADFTLRASNMDKSILPADPNTMAFRINEKDEQSTDVAIYTYEGINYSTGYDQYDRDYGTSRHGGVSTTTGVAVEMKPNKRDPKTSAADTKAMIAELTEKSLPEAEVSKPVAGYLYFSVNNDKPATYQLEYRTSDGTNVLIPLPKPAE